MEKNAVYGYFTVKSNDYRCPGLGYACVRVDRPALGTTGKYKASFAFCSPNDAPKQRHMLNRNFRSVFRRIVDSRMKGEAVLNRRGKARVNHVEFEFDKTDKRLPDLITHALKLAPVPQWFDSGNAVYGLDFGESRDAQTAPQAA